MADDVGRTAKASIRVTSGRDAQDSDPITRGRVAWPDAGELVLPYDHSIVPQETGMAGGKAATQVVLNLPRIKSQRGTGRARSAPTRAEGATSADERDLDRRCPQAGYVWSECRKIRRLRAAQRLWRDLFRASRWLRDDHERVDPPSNYQRGAKRQHLAAGMAAGPYTTTCSARDGIMTTPGRAGGCGSRSRLLALGSGAVRIRSPTYPAEGSTRTPTPQP